MGTMNRTYRSTLVANETSRAYKVQGNPNDASLEPVSIQIFGTWSGCTVTLQTSNADSSPLVYTATATTWTAAGAKVVELVTGTQFRLVVTSSGSPQTNITASVRGQIAIAS